MNLKKMIEMTKDDIHVVLRDGSDSTKLSTEIFYDGLSQNVDLDTYGDYEVIHTMDRADWPDEVQFWIRQSEK